jgi:hypothetical protein
MNDVNPNLFAYVALLISPVLILYLFSRLTVPHAIIWSILGAYLLLPVGTEIKFQHIPAFTKDTIPALAVLLCCLMHTGRLPKFFHGFGFAEFLIGMLLFGPFITSELNTDPIRIGETFLPGVGAYDALSAAVAQLIFILPFFIGRHFLRRSDSTLNILQILAMSGLAYSVPILFEVRMSPQLNVWVYGYLPSSFAQEVRDGGFRPVVFLGHGLAVAFFAMTSTVAAAALWRLEVTTVRFRSSTVTVYLGIILLLCKTVSALLYASLAVPLVRLARPRFQLRVASFLVLFALAYPMLRVADLVPTASILQVANIASADRADSLQTRFENEELLLQHAWQRPWFGWGRFGRNRVYNGWMGRDSTTIDGYWIITFGVFGLVGFVGTFGLLALSVFRAMLALRHAQTTREAYTLAALGLIVAINIVDLVPNSSISSWTWLLVGSLLGQSEFLYGRAQQLTRQRAALPSSIGQPGSQNRMPGNQTHAS